MQLPKIEIAIERLVKQSVQENYNTSNSSQEIGKKLNGQVDIARDMTSEQLSQSNNVVKRSR